MEALLNILTMDPVCIALIIIGVLLLCMEIFLPGFGVPGISGLILTVVGIYFKADTVLEGMIWAICIIALLVVVMSISLHSASRGALRKSPLVLQDSTSAEEGFRSTDDLTYFLGKEGKTITVLRPAGIADFDDVKLDVVTEGEFIEAGKAVKIIRVEGRRIVVRTA